MERQTHNPLKRRLGAREITFAIPVLLLIKAEEVQRDIVDATLDVRRAHRINKCIPFSGKELDDVEMPRVLSRIIREKRGPNLGKLRQFSLIDLREMLAAFVLFVEFHELTQPHRRLNICHVVFVAFGGDVVTPDAAVRLARPCVFINAVEAHRAERFGERVAVSGNHAAFRRR